MIICFKNRTLKVSALSTEVEESASINSAKNRTLSLQELYNFIKKRYFLLVLQIIIKGKTEKAKRQIWRSWFCLHWKPIRVDKKMNHTAAILYLNCLFLVVN